MRRIWLYSVFILILLLFLVGCSEKTSGNLEVEAKESDEVSETQLEKDSTEVEQEDVSKSEPKRIYETDIIKKLTNGINQKKVIDRLGTEYVTVIDPQTEEQVWRYDIGANDDYQFHETHKMIDLNGLRSGDVQMQLFVTWLESDDVYARRYDLYYTTPESEIYHYSLANGAERDRLLYDSNGVYQEESGPEVEITREDVRDLISKFAIGMSKERAIEVFGNDYVDVISALNDQPLWRYDFDKREGFDLEGDGDFVDLNAIINGDIDMYLFIAWTGNDTSENFSLHYIDYDQNQYHSYYLFEDGFEKIDVRDLNVD